VVVTKKIDTQYGEADGGEKKGPCEPPTAEAEVQPLLAPARDDGPTRTAEQGSTRGRRGGVREDGEGGAGVDKKTPVGQLIGDEDQLAGGDGVEAPPAV
jgi:hypothetical protein